MASEKTYSLQEDIKWVRSLYRDHGEIPIDAIGYTLGLLPRFLDALEAVPTVAASPTGAVPVLDWRSIPDDSYGRHVAEVSTGVDGTAYLTLWSPQDDGDEWGLHRDIGLDINSFEAADPEAAKTKAESLVRRFFAAGLAALQPQPTPAPGPTLEWKDGRAAVEGDGWRAAFSLQDPERTGLELSCDWYLPCDISDFWNNHEMASEAEAFALADVWCKQLAGIAAVLKAHEPVFLACEAGALAGTEVRDG